MEGGTLSRVTTRLLGLIIVVFFPVTISVPLGMLASCRLSVCCQNLIFSPVCGKDPLYIQRMNLPSYAAAANHRLTCLKKKKKKLQDLYSSFKPCSLKCRPCLTEPLAWGEEDRVTVDAEAEVLGKSEGNLMVQVQFFLVCTATQCSGVLALTSPQELFPLNYAVRKSVGDTRQQYYTCISSIFFFNFFWQTILFVLESDFGLMFSIPPPVAAPGEAELNVKDEQRVWRAVGVTSISRGAGREDYTSVLLQNNFYVQQRPMCWRLKLKTVMFFYHLQFLFCVLDFCKQKRQE